MLSGLPFVGALQAAPILHPSVPKTTIFVYDRTLTREKIAVFDLEGKTYGMRMSYEYMEAVEECHSVSAIDLLVQFVSICVEGITGTMPQVVVRQRIGRVPEYEEAKCVFSKYFVPEDETSDVTIPYRKVEGPVRIETEDQLLSVFGRSVFKPITHCYFRVEFEAGNHGLSWYI